MLRLYKFFPIFFVFFIISVCSSLAENLKGSIIIASTPIDCEVLIGYDSKDIKDISIKGGVIINQIGSMLNIKKKDFLLSIDGIQLGKIPICFKRGDISIKSEVDIQEGKLLLVNGNFANKKVYMTPNVFIGKDGSLMVLIPSGEFQMGSDKGDTDEQPIHNVNLDEFYIDIFEVTNAQYKKFIESTGHKPPMYWNDPKCNAPNQPVVGVTWQDAVDYCKWAGKELPTEAEWEKSARGGLIGKEYPNGDEEMAEAPSGQENSGLDSAYPVGCFSPNPYGIYDMERNAWEWCYDWYDEEYYSKSPIHNPQGPESGKEKVLRGGSWFSGIYTPLPVAYRYSLEPTKSSILIGFRCKSRNIN